MLFGIAGALFVLAQAPADVGQLGKTIEYTTRATTIQRALSDISRQAGVTLLVSPELEAEPIVLKIHGATTFDTMKHIARCVQADWQLKNHSYLLYRPEETGVRLEQELLSKRSKQIEVALAAKLSGIEKVGPFTPAAARAIANGYVRGATQSIDSSDNGSLNQRLALADKMPDQRALWQLLKSVDLRLLAGLRRGQRLSFSSKPGSVQRAMPEPDSNFLEQWRVDHNLLAIEVNRALGGATVRESLFEEGAPGLPWKSPPDRVSISARRDSYGDSFRFALFAFDHQGHVTAGVNGSLQLMDAAKMNSILKRAQGPKKSTPAEIAFSPESKQLLECVNATAKNGEIGLAAGGLRKILLDPTTVDPLALVASDVLLAASGPEENLVAYPDDALGVGLCYSTNGGVLTRETLRDVLENFMPVPRAQFVASDGWIEVRSASPLESVEERANRRILGEFLHAIDEKGHVSLEDLAYMSANIRGNTAPYLDAFIPTLILRGSYPFQDSTLALLRLYGTLDDVQRQRMQDGQPIPIAELQDDQLSALNKLIYETDNKGPMPLGKGAGFSQTQLDLMLFRESYERYPNGLPASTTISFTPEAKETYLVRLLVDGTPYQQTLNFDQLAYTIVEFERESVQEHPRSVVTVTPAKQRKLKFSMKINDEVVRSEELDEIEPTGEELAPDKLKGDLKARLNARLDELRDAYSRMPKASDAKPPLFR